MENTKELQELLSLSIKQQFDKVSELIKLLHQSFDLRDRKEKGEDVDAEMIEMVKKIKELL